MIKLFAVAVICLFSAGCQHIDYLENDIGSLRSDLQQLVNSGQVITGVNQTSDGYTLSFSNGKSVTLSNGKNGADGKDGDSFFKSVEVDKDRGIILITLSDGTDFTVKMGSPVSMVNELVYMPRYADGKATLNYTSGENYSSIDLVFKVVPEAAADMLSSEGCEFTASAEMVCVKTRSVDGDGIVLPCEVSFGGGKMEVKVDPKAVFEEGLEKEAMMISVKLEDDLGVFCSEYIPLFVENTGCDYLRFNSVEGEGSVCISSSEGLQGLEFSYDRLEWDAVSSMEKMTLADGDTLFLRGSDPDCFSASADTKFVMTGKIAAGGSVMSLLDRRGEALEMPENRGFSGLFSGCQSLVSAPALPAAKLSKNCYKSMFEGCSSLEKAPELPANELVEGCYDHMFSGCGALNYVKALFVNKDTDIQNHKYLTGWLEGVASEGVFIKYTLADWTQPAVVGIPAGWTVEKYGPLVFHATTGDFNS